MWPHIEDVKAFHCPADDRVSIGNVGWRSYSMSGGLGGAPAWGIPENKAINHIEELAYPADKYIIVEERGKNGGQDWWNMGSWVVNWGSDPKGWGDLVALWHMNGINLAFADGHAEWYKWKDPVTIEWLESGYPQPLLADHVGNPDMSYMVQHFCAKP